ncbi:bifunctional diguanylate cyclase/phosphodiesterase [Actinotalea sp. M2MS4P-6]|uniref:putative bifunctional diguanylate cyclase/phosphodiesterase n=1 Tax=Actinotalea sp. M2MS4P-6 TaxID=2983762 RepID=UPI0021E4A690|nr:bifunctional diguanylate cyclase/phosphodiesterase [Actinotalea sp. M2MS4P-6]MCV2395106.1 bifunctional diguanylate cyclase/phosphodiesterase [Actinotalea sp. M2MS4P-6]
MPLHPTDSAQRGRSYPGRTGQVVAVGLTASAAVAYAGSASVGMRGTPLVALLAAMHLGGALVLMARSLYVRRERRAWAAFAAAFVAAACGDAAWAVAGGNAPPPLPSVACYLAAVPLLYVGIVRLIPRSEHLRCPRLCLDALILGLALGGLTVGAADRFTHLAERPAGALAALLVAPMADLLLGSLLLTILMLGGWRRDPRLALLLLAVGSIGISHTAIALAGRGAADPPPVAAAFTALATVLVVAAAWSSQARRPVLAPRAWVVRAGPTISLGLAIVVVAAGGLGHMPRVCVLLGTAAMVGMVGRLHLTLADERRAADEALWLASTDTLTGLANRHAFVTQAGQVLDAATSSGQSVALVMADLDRFKDVNDSLGHAAGDDVLVAVAKRLRDCVDADDAFLARFSGDEFAILLPGGDRDRAVELCERIRGALADPVHVDGVTIAPTASLGVAVAPSDATTLALLMRRADIALDRAKSGPGAYATYDPSLGDPEGENRLQRAAALRAAIAGGEVVPHYQPKVDLASGRVVGVEALVRWERPGSETIQPAAFLPLATAAALMPELTTCVLEAAVVQLATWHATGRDLEVAVNIATETITDPDFAARVLATLDRHGVAGQRLVLEITEDSLMREADRSAAVLTHLRQAGIRIAIDDFGQGYSSLARLRDLPVDELKLDRAFISTIGQDAGAAAIVRSTVDLAHSLGLQIVAEGVEDATAAALLQDFGCDTAQGFLFATALTPSALTVWLDARLDEATDALPRPRTPFEDAAAV